MGTNAAATIDDAIAALDARRAEPPYALQPGRPCTLPQLYEALSKRDGKRKRDAAAGAAAAATAGAGEGGGSAPRQAPRSSGAPASAPADDGYYADEEPF